MFDIKQFKDSSAIIRDSSVLGSGDHLVHAARSESRFDDFYDCFDSVDV